MKDITRSSIWGEKFTDVLINVGNAVSLSTIGKWIDISKTYNDRHGIRQTFAEQSEFVDRLSDFVEHAVTEIMKFLEETDLEDQEAFQRSEFVDRLSDFVEHAVTEIMKFLEETDLEDQEAFQRILHVHYGSPDLSIVGVADHHGMNLATQKPRSKTQIQKWPFSVVIVPLELPKLARIPVYHAERAYCEVVDDLHSTQ
uniref:Uncharacterized protein n=1 Tax=Timema monikensis TaxID=170555 RepID=A0A7R9EH42_9NEOP|nr:unnamed protein product [Timema monikensis]